MCFHQRRFAPTLNWIDASAGEILEHLMNQLFALLARELLLPAAHFELAP
jgi:hypothetical protein